jgi:HNH endonuclease/NUMOD4 motif
MENFENEEWRVVDGFPMYKVSNFGRVYSSYKSGKILTPVLDSYGYHKLTLCSNKSKVNCTIHRLVCCAFLQVNESKPLVNHKNGIKTDNRLENLEWCTPKENTHHAIATGLINIMGENSCKSILTPSDVIEIRRLSNLGWNPKKIVSELSLLVDETTVRDAAVGRSWVGSEYGATVNGFKTPQFGEVSHKAVLTERMVREMRKRANNGEVISMIATEMGINDRTVRGAISGKNWKHLNEIYPPFRGKKRIF